MALLLSRMCCIGATSSIGTEPIKDAVEAVGTAYERLCDHNLAKKVISATARVTREAIVSQCAFLSFSRPLS